MDKKKMVFRALLIVCCAIGLFIKTGIYQLAFRQYTLIYYTNLSNIYVLGVFIYAVTCKKGYDQHEIFLRIKGSMTLAILLTGIVYHFLLVPTGFLMGGSSPADWIGNILLHYVTPLMALADWILWDRKGVFTTMEPLLWLIFPLYYLLFAVIQAQFGGFIPNQESRYPYPFIAADLLGWGTVLKNVLAIGIFFIFLGYLMLVIDNYLNRKKWLFAK